MNKYEEYEDMFPLPNSVSEDVVYVSYVDKGLQFFKTKAEAEKAGKFIAKEVTNKDEIEKYKQDVKKLRAKIYNTWIEDLKNECGYLRVSGTFDDARLFCIGNCHCNSNDDIANAMLDLDFLASKIKKGFTQK